MRKLILASASPQRKKLLKLLGKPFTVKHSKAQEIEKIRTSVTALVEHNALLKARDIASGEKNSLVIAADTVVYGHGRLILKPKNLKDARNILKRLFSRPHYVYTGLAVIDSQTGKEVTAVEKTKVFMTPLSEKEIAAYHKRVPPTDKAGGFDIEGLGSIFIRRIEGDYTNVIGLPLARLYKILKKFDVALSLVLCFFLCSCTSEYDLATHKTEYYLHSRDREMAIGLKMHTKVMKKYKLYENVEQNERVQKIFKKLVAANKDRTDVVYSIYILDEKDINAFSLPGGYIYLFRGVLDIAKTDDQIAAVIAHEMGHISARHGMKRLQASYGATLLELAATQAGGNAAYGVNVGLNSLFIQYSQQEEFEADRLGVKYMKGAGYNPEGAIRFLELMKKEEDKKGPQPFSYWRTHPHISERIGNIGRAIKGKMDFKDYLKLIDQDEFNPERGW